MPIHLLWGDDEAARNRAVETLIEQQIDPAWQALNLSRLDGNEASQAAQALDESRTPPFGSGARVVVLQRSPFCNQCPADLASQFEASLALVNPACQLLLVNSAKPDARLRTTKALQQQIKAGKAHEQSFALPAIWDGAGQVELVARSARDLGHVLEPGAAELLAEAIGSDSARLASELDKLSLFAASQSGGGGPASISREAVAALVGGRSISALAVGDALLAGNPAEALALLDALLEANEPALRLVASLSSQIRGWLWVALLERAGERDPAVIAKAAGIGNPKRIFVMRKQIRGKTPELLLNLLSQLLDVEASLKRGTDARDAFCDGFLVGSSRPSAGL